MAMRWFAVFLSTIILRIYVTVPGVREAIQQQTTASISQTSTV
jgi:hypothetical protein